MTENVQCSGRTGPCLRTSPETSPNTERISGYPTRPCRSIEGEDTFCPDQVSDLLKHRWLEAEGLLQTGIMETYENLDVAHAIRGCNRLCGPVGRNPRTALFRDSTIAGTKLTASRLVQVMGYGSALVLLWLAARQAALQRTEGCPATAVVRHLLIPTVTLFTVLLGHQVLLLLLGPFLDRTVKGLYNWAFVIGTVSAASWVAVAWFRNASAILESMAVVKDRRGRDELTAQRQH